MTPTSALARPSILLASSLALMSCVPQQQDDRPIVLSELASTVAGESREVGYTNKRAGFFSTETSAPHRTGWQGWYVFAHKILHDYALFIDGERLNRSSATQVTVFPHQLTRRYENGVTETVTLADSIDALIVQVCGLSARKLALRPFFSDASVRDEFVVLERNHSLLIARRKDLTGTAERNVPIWIGLRITGAGASEGSLLDAATDGSSFSPAGLSSLFSGSELTAVLAAGATDAATERLLNEAAEHGAELVLQRQKRMEGLLDAAFVRTNNPRFDKALHWAMLSLDALVMEQGKKGIFAGLPWFSNYWGRDSFISLPGATLVNGRFADARDILRSFAQWQDVNPASPTYGRIPNVVNPASLSYNTTDGTPWFVIALGEYVRYSGDLDLPRELFPVVRRSVEGAWKNHTDGQGFLTHGDAETWMDAVGTSGPWSPRGNRANDVQALWHRQLETAAWLADLCSQKAFADRCRTAAATVRQNFRSRFVDTATVLVYDHLNIDGTADLQMRPNQLFVFDLLKDDPRLTSALFKRITEELVYPHGVASLSQNDPDFHPFHHYAPFYVQDAAYHNGIVWTWLAGPWIHQAVQLGYENLAYRVTDAMVDQILERGAVGTLSELLDAAPRPGEDLPRLSGTFSQAWSLAEFVRSFYQDYLGVHVDVPGRTLYLQPRLPSALRRAKANLRVGEFTVQLALQASESDGRFELLVPAGCPAETVRVDWILAQGQRHQFALPLQQGTTVVTLDPGSVHAIIGQNPTPAASVISRVREPEPLRLAVPTVRAGLRSLQGPSHRILTHAEVTAAHPDAVVMVDLADLEGDDVGTGGFRYPTTPHLKPGSLDLVRFRVAIDRTSAHVTLRFRSLSNPRWHPEYGFQLTFAAIAVRFNDNPAGKGRELGMNSNVIVPEDYAFDRLIAVGGGVRVSDGTGKILAEYVPQPGDEKNPLGNASTGTVAFSIPRELLTTAEDNWTFAVFVGAQDDHGGAGIGEFRSVERLAGEWVGGGRKRPSDPNIFDTLFTGQPQQHSHP